MIRTHAIAGILGGILMLQALLGIAPAHAQQSGVQLSANVGYEGAFRTSLWTPIRITANNIGPSTKGIITWQTANSSASFSQEIDLPNGAQKQLTLSVQIPSSTRSGTLSFISDGTTLAQQNIRLEELDSGTQTLVAIASSDSGLLNSLSGRSPGLFNSTKVAHITLADIPEQASLLASVNVLFLHDLDTSALTSAQRTALEVWIGLGGNLVISGGSGDTKLAAGLGDLMPVDLPGGYRDADLNPLGQSRTDTTRPASATVSNATARARTVTSYESLIFTRTLGKGQTIFTAFDLTALRAWALESQFWGNVIKPNSYQDIYHSIQDYNGFTQWFEIEELTLIPIWALFLIFATYILALGPLNYFILRRINRLELAWATIPLIVILFVSGIYIGGNAMRGGNIQTFQISIVQGSEGTSEGLTSSYTGLFSPKRNTYTLGLGENTVLRQYQSRNYYYADEPIEGSYRTNDQGMQLWENVIDIGEMRTIMSEHTAPINMSITSDIRIRTASIGGSITYNGEPLEDAMVINSEGLVQELGTLSDGQEKTIQLSQASPSLQQQNMPSINKIRRDVIIQSLPNALQAGRTGAYLIGWKSQASDPFTINGSTSTPQGATLYIIRLNTQSQ